MENSRCFICDADFPSQPYGSISAESGALFGVCETCRRKIGEHADIASLKAEVERLTAERDQARNQFVELAKLLLPVPGEPTIDGDKIVTPLSDSPLLRRMTELMITALKSGPGNFHTVTFQTTKDGQEYSLTIQREGGKTPAQKIAELTAEVERLTAENAKLETDAKLGRLVLKALENGPVALWEWEDPLEALESAGVVEDKAGVTG